MIAKAAKYQSRDVTDYGTYFGLSTHSWRKSTEPRAFSTFSATLTRSRSRRRAGPRIRPIALRRSPTSSTATAAWPIRISTARKAIRSRNRSPATPSHRRSSRERWPPSSAAMARSCMTLSRCPLPLPICQRYLMQGAYGYFGSSTIAYGPAEGNGAADLITQYFLLAVLEGASLGRAALVARQRFVQQTAELDPVDLKTLGQFNLLGDPSIHPARLTNATGLPEGRRHRVRATASSGANVAPSCATWASFCKRSKPTASRKASESASRRQFGRRWPISHAKPGSEHGRNSRPSTSRRRQAARRAAVRRRRGLPLLCRCLPA